MSADTPEQAELVARIEAHALRLAVLDDRAVRAADAYTAAAKEAHPDFAAARNRGVPQVKPRLPDGSEPALFALLSGGQTIDVDEDLLLGIIAAGSSADLEDYVLPAAWADDRVIKLLADHFPEFVGCRIRRGARALLQKQIEEKHGCIVDPATNELEKVATITPLAATGRFQLRADKRSQHMITAALEAGLITETGEIIAQADAEPAAPASAVPAPRTKAAVIPTAEQQAVMDAFAEGVSLVVEAGAGTGKTSTLALAAAAVPSRRGLYVAYNRAIADDAKGKFPPSVRCSTAHALAMGAVGHMWRHRLNGPRIPARQQAKLLSITGAVKAGDKMLAPERIARLAIETVENFCKSADEEPGAWHVPWKPGLDTKDVHAELADQILPVARRAWADLSAREGTLRFDHGHYLKHWQLSHPVLSADFILFDEAQDASPVILDVIVSQKDSQLVAVGDRNQAINGWTGAVNSMDRFPADMRLPLSQSFRFGRAVAREANKWLAILGADLRLTGFDRISSKVATLENPDAILCRTNAEAMSQAMTAMGAGRATAIVGGGEAIRALAEAAEALKAGRPTSHPELFAFTSWAEVQDHAANDATGSDLRVLVDLIDDHGPEKIIAMVGQLTDEIHAQTVISTAHKAKGREWDSVRIATDFREPRRDPEHDGEPEIPADVAMLAYVAVTRAKLTLDRAGLAWVDKYATTS
jgi:hypothetical protein